jgi:hypothetical protein
VTTRLDPEGPGRKALDLLGLVYDWFGEVSRPAGLKAARGVLEELR